MPQSQPGTVLRYLRRLAVGRDTPEQTDLALLHAFCTDDDQAAFAALVRRHGPLVWGLCRQALGHLQDAEDAFQATFLVLARKAGSIRKGEALVSWLHGVAYRTTLNAKRTAARMVTAAAQCLGLVSRNYRLDHIRTGPRRRCHIADRHRRACRNSHAL